MTASPEAVKLRAEIASADAEVRRLTGQIRNREGRLRRIAADAFNELSEPIDGMTIEVREVALGTRTCDASPIGICVCHRLYRSISIPGQLAIAAGRDTSKDPATRGNACLFCGRQEIG